MTGYDVFMHMYLTICICMTNGANFAIGGVVESLVSYLQWLDITLFKHLVPHCFVVFPALAFHYHTPFLFFFHASTGPHYECNSTKWSDGLCR